MYMYLKRIHKFTNTRKDYYLSAAVHGNAMSQQKQVHGHTHGHTSSRNFILTDHSDACKVHLLMARQHRAAYDEVICCHCPSVTSFHNVTLSLPSVTAKMLPVMLQLTRQTGSWRRSKAVLVHAPLPSSVHTSA